MKSRLTIYIQRSFLLVLLFIATGCRDELTVENNGEGKWITVSIPFRTSMPRVEARASTEEEYRLEDLYLFIFDETGTVMKYKYYYTGEALSHTSTFDPTAPPGGENTTSGSLSLTVSSGPSYIYAVGNLDNSTFPGLKGLLDGVTSKSEFLDVMATFPAMTPEQKNDYLYPLDGKFPMSGYFVPEGGTIAGKEVGYINIQPGRLSGEITLKRMYAKIEFNIAAATSNNISFTPISWKVYHLPVRSNLTGMSSVEISPRAEYFFDSNEETFSNQSPRAFTFYMQENMQSGKKAILPETINPYFYREKQEKIATGETVPAKDKGDIRYESYPTYRNGDFEYAPDYGTYIELYGNFESNDYTGKVKYVIHLGFAGNNVNDFSVVRNTHYKYTVTVEGVNNIVLECLATSPDVEAEPGSEGKLFDKSKGEEIRLDAHYETVLLKFSKSNIRNREGKFDFQVITPFWESPILNVDDFLAGGQKIDNDYKWAKFVRNSAGTDASKFRSYGEARMDIMDLLWELKCVGQTLERATSWTDLVINDDPIHFPNVETERALWEYFYSSQPSGSPETGDEANIYYTCHIDEFFYETRPGGGSPVEWSEFVNRPDRELYILVDSKLSPDQASMLYQATYCIQQRSIKTFFEPSTTREVAVYGLETINETGTMVKTGTLSSCNDENNGWKNMLNQVSNNTSSSSWTNQQWSTYIDVEINGYVNFTGIPGDLTSTRYNALKSSTINALAYACLQRNRDLNGDGIISDDEVKWYMPARNQYVGMWIGEEGLDQDSRLYHYSTLPDVIEEHYYTNTKNEVIWVEEGSSFGSMGQSPVRNLQYRCVRNLTSTAYTDNSLFPSVGSDNIVDLSRFSSKAMRNTSMNNELGGHNERDPLNKPYRKFELEGGNWSSRAPITARAARSTVTNCPEGYRVPNQRELALIAMANQTARQELHCRTLFSNQNHRYGYMYTSLMTLLSTADGLYGPNKNGRVRCVRDRN